MPLILAWMFFIIDLVYEFQARAGSVHSIYAIIFLEVDTDRYNLTWSYSIALLYYACVVIVLLQQVFQFERNNMIL